MGKAKFCFSYLYNIKAITPWFINHCLIKVTPCFIQSQFYFKLLLHVCSI